MIIARAKFFSQSHPAPEGESYWLWWSPDFSSSAISRTEFCLILWNISVSTWSMGTILCRHSWFPDNESYYYGDPLTFPVAWGWHLRGILWNVSTCIGWINGINLMTFGTDIHGPQGINPNDCGGTMRFIFVVLGEISQQLFDGFPWSVVPIFISPQGWILITLLIPWLFIWSKFQFVQYFITNTL